MAQEVIEVVEREVEVIEILERGLVGPTGPVGPQANINYTVVSSSQAVSNRQMIATDTSGGSFTLTLPSNPAAGDAIDIFDYSDTFDTNPLTIARNGQNIEGLADDLVANVEGAYFTLIFTGGSRGWQVVPRYGVSGLQNVLTTEGDLLYRGGSAETRLGIGTAGQILKVNSGATAPEWGNEVMSAADKTKLDGIAAGAEVNVNADWNAVSGDAQILNKPATFTPSSHTHGNITNDGKIGATSGLPVVTTTDGAVTTLALGTANQVLRVNSGATGVEFGAGFDAASPPAIGGQNPNTGVFTNLSAALRLNLPSSGNTLNDIWVSSGQVRYQSGSLVTSARTLLTAEDNLSTLTNTATARANLGLGTAATANLDALSDSAFRIADNNDATKKLAFELSGISTATTRTLTVPNASGTIALTSDIPAAFDPASPGTIGATTPAAATFTNLTANTRLNIPNTNGTTAGDIYRNADTLRYRDSSNTERTLLSGAGNLANLTDTATARTNIGLGSANNVTFGSIQNTPIGSTTPAAGSFSTLNATGTTELVNGGTTAGPFRLYNISSAANANFERLSLRWASNVAIIGTEKAGTGSARPLEFQTDGTTTLTLSTALSGTFARHILLGGTSLPSRQTNTTGFWGLWPGANTSVMASTASGFEGILFNSNLVRGSDWQCQDTARPAWHLSMRHGSSADAFEIFRAPASAGALTFALFFRINSLGLIQIGGTTNQFPALKRSSTTLQVRLADDSAFAPLECAGLTLNGNLTASTRNIVTDTTTGTRIGTGTTQLLGFWNATPSAQPAAVADATDAATVITQLNALLSRLRTIGLIAT